MIKNNKLLFLVYFLFALTFAFDHYAFCFTVNYQYDDQYRLTKVVRSDGTVIDYQYDNSGNRLRKILSIPGPVVTAAFNMNPTSGQAPLLVSFADQSTGPVTSWSWNFGDGTTSTIQNPSHTYNAPGSYTVQLTVTDATSFNNTTRTVTVSPDTTPPVVTFSMPENSASLSVPITINASDAAGISAYLISESSAPPTAADPAWAANPPTSWVFTTPGNKVLYVWVKDANGNISVSRSDSVTITLSVPSIPSGVAVQYEAIQSRNYITWNAVAGATNYKVYWSTVAGVTTGSMSMPLTSTVDYGHTGVVAGATYYYRVAAINSYGESALSGEVSVTVPIPLYGTLNVSASYGSTIYTPSLANYQYHYGPSIILNGSTFDMWATAPGPGNPMDYIQHRRGTVDTVGTVQWLTNWTNAITATSGSLDQCSTADPSVIYFNGYYYIGYTSTDQCADGGKSGNQIFVARCSGLPDGSVTCDKWNGTGWGGNPQPIIHYSGTGWGKGQPSFVVKNNILYMYYTDGGTKVVTVDATNANWPASINEAQASTIFTNDGATTVLGGKPGPFEVKYIDKYSKFIGIGVSSEFSSSSNIFVYESTDGISFQPVVTSSSYWGSAPIQQFAHNIGISGDSSGHLDADANNFVAYGYGLPASQTDAQGYKAKWPTYLNLLSVTATAANVECSSNSACGSGFYCSKSVGACTENGACAARPDACTALVDPVCGCNGQTFSNSCLAAQAGVSVAYQGECVSNFTLTVNKSGTGTGAVSSAPAGIACGVDCSEVYTTGTSITLTATPDADAVFAGWSGSCTGTTTTCSVTMDAAKTVTAMFDITIPWGVPVHITAVPATYWPYTSKSNSGATIVTDATGTVHMVYQYVQDDQSGIVNGTGPRVIKQDILYMKKTGSIWSVPQTVYSVTTNTDSSLNGYRSFANFRIAVDSNSRPHVLWTGSLSGGCLSFNSGEVYYAYHNGSAWIDPVNVSNNATASTDADIAIDNADQVHIVWSDGRTWDASCGFSGVVSILHRIKSSNGSWNAAAIIPGSSLSGRNSALAQGAGNDVHLAFTTSDGTADRPHYTVWNGTQWVTPVTIGPDEKIYAFVDLAVDSGGKAHVAYAFMDNANLWRLGYTGWNGTAWTTPETFSETANSYEKMPAIVLDSHGDPSLVWYESTANDNRILYRKRTAQGWTATTVLSTQASQPSQRGISAAVGGGHLLHAVWEVSYNGSTEIFYNGGSVLNIVVDDMAPVTTASPEAGTYNTVQSVTLIASEQATIYYTSDGTTPSESSSVYSTPIPISSTTTLKFFAKDTAGNAEAVKTQTYTIESPVPQPEILFEDNFNDNSLDTNRWRYGGNTVTETEGQIQVKTTVTDQIGWLESAWIGVNHEHDIIVRKKTLLHYGNDRFMGETNIVTDQNESPLFIRVMYGNMAPWDSNYCAVYGIYITKNGSNPHYCSIDPSNYSSAVTPLWDQWFEEKIIYNPVTGVVSYYMDDQKKMEYNVGPLPAGVQKIRIGLNAWGWWTGHYHHVDDFSVAQAASTGPSRSLTISKSGTGAGAVISDPAGIDCGTDCSESFAPGSSVTLTAAPAAGSLFAEWSGACSGTSQTCVLTMDAAKTVTAVFNDVTPPLAPAVAGESLTRNSQPTWSWSPGGGGNGTYRFKLDDGDLTNGATETTATSYTPTAALSEGIHTLYIQERDGAGNWSPIYSDAIVLDTTPPVTTATPSGNTYVGSLSVSLSASEQATIYFTTDNTTPSESSSVYSTPFSISATTTLKLFAKDPAGNAEDVQTIVYDIQNASMGDVNSDDRVDLADAVLAMQVLSGVIPAQPVHHGTDVNGDGKIGLPEVFYILQKVASLRSGIDAAHTISGRIVSGTSPLSGAMVTLSGASSSTTTSDIDGHYSFGNVANGNYTITPSLASKGYTFIPADISVTIDNANVAEKNFTGTSISHFMISGRITSGGAPLPGVTVTATVVGHSYNESTKTNAAGFYYLSALGSAGYTITPTLAGYVFSPASGAAELFFSDISGPNFTAVQLAGIAP